MPYTAPVNLLTSLPAPMPDPIFAVTELAKAAGSKAINGTIGVYTDEQGKAVLFPSVKKALETVSTTLTTRSYNYPSLLGLPEFRGVVAKLLFGNDQEMHASIAATSGTGAIGIILRLLKKIDPAFTIILPSPSWAAHRLLIAGADMQLQECDLTRNGKASIEPILETLEKTTGPRAVLLQTGCHNPTGLNYSLADWQTLAEALKKHDVIAFLDTAYQGFGTGPEEDMEPLRIFLKAGVTIVGSWSASKNHSLYSERTGLAYAVTENEPQKKQIEGLFMNITRTIHSAAATFGQSVVTEVQKNHADEWRRDLETVRVTLRKKRQALSEAIPAFAEALKGEGMFASLPITQAQLLKLQSDHSVFFADGGRINIAGIPFARIPEVRKAIESVS